MFKKLCVLSLLALFLFINAGTVAAENPVVSSSARLKSHIRISNSEYDIRALKLQMYLRKQASPMEPYTKVIIAHADKYNIDWRLVAAIAGVESSFGKYMPKNSYNAFGWANGKYKFSSWEEAINTVSKTLKANYIDKGATNIESIAKKYAPPSLSWAGNVKYFINQIDTSPVEFSK